MIRTHLAGATVFLLAPLVPSQSVVTNAPVVPDAIYLARPRGAGGLSVVDLNGFGGGTGDPSYSIVAPILEGNSNFPNNPNLFLQGALLIPPLFPGTTTRDGGSSGVFTLAPNSALDVVHGRGAHVADLMLGAPLDLVFNNGDCNLCSRTQVLSVAFAPPHGLVPDLVSPIHVAANAGNPISFAPHPNPPPLLDGGGCGAVEGMEPTSVLSALAPPLGVGLVNLLAPGPNFLGDPAIGLPPTNLLARQQNAFFAGPGVPQPSILSCPTFHVRQQVGHFLYLAERRSRALVVVSSNRMTELARIPMADPSELAMSPDLSFLAVSNRRAGTVDFVDVDPRSSRFHEVVRSLPVGRLPLGIAWDPGAEDVLVCNEGDGTVTIVSASTLEVRKTLRGLERPFAVAVTPRQHGFGLERGVYFAWILQRDGRLLLYESGPGGRGGWGFDEIVGEAPFRFRRPRAIQPDHRDLAGGVWIAHEGPLGSPGDEVAPAGSGGALTNVVLRGRTGVIPLVPGEPPRLRELQLVLARSIGQGPEGLSGAPLDLAFDDQTNLGALPGYHTPFSAGSPAVANGKGLVREVPGVGILATNDPRLVFVPTRAGVVDVIDLETGSRTDTDPFHEGVQSIAAPGFARAMSYFRQ